MTELGATFERDDLGGGRFQLTQHLRRIAFRNNGSWARIVNNFMDGDVNFPHVVSLAPMLVYVGSDGLRRICPTHDPNVWFAIGAPYIKPAGTWQKVNLGSPTRSGNTLTWSIAQADVSIAMAGHFIKLEIALKGGYVPPNGQFAFPVDVNGLTRQGTNLLDAQGNIVLSTQAPIVYDAANRLDIRPITTSIVNVSGQNYLLFTLPSLTGMTSPVVDPTLTLQPDATDGNDAFITGGVVATWNYGANALTGIGEVSGVYRTLIKFDLSSLPVNATISAATLSLYASADNATNARTFRVYRQKRLWLEGTRTGAADSPATGATWNRFDLTNSWQTAGGFGANDCEQTAIGSRDFTASETLNQFKDFSLTPTTKTGLDYGLEQGGSATGWMLKADTESADEYSFATSDDTTAANRPKLVIVYTLPGGGHHVGAGVGQGVFAGVG